MNKRQLKKLYKRTYAERDRLEYEVRHPILLIHIQVEDRNTGPIVYDYMASMNEDGASFPHLREELERALRNVFLKWREPELEYHRQREKILEQQLLLSRELSAPPLKIVAEQMKLIVESQKGTDHA